jgi:hypothetical protein
MMLLLSDEFARMIKTRDTDEHVLSEYLLHCDWLFFIHRLER